MCTKMPGSSRSASYQHGQAGPKGAQQVASGTLRLFQTEPSKGHRPSNDLYYSLTPRLIPTTLTALAAEPFAALRNTSLMLLVAVG